MKNGPSFKRFTILQEFQLTGNWELRSPNRFVTSFMAGKPHAVQLHVFVIIALKESAEPNDYLQRLQVSV